MRDKIPHHPRGWWLWGLFAISLGTGMPMPGLAQDHVVITGTIVDAGTGQPVHAVSLLIRGTRISTLSDREGAYELTGMPPGEYLIFVRRVGYRPQTLVARVDGNTTIDIQMTASAIMLGDIVVTGASRTPERIVEVPSALAAVEPGVAEDLAATGQAPRVLATLPGVDVVQNGMYDYHVNARGFNTFLNRRILVLQDGRDLALPFGGAQEWTAMSMAMDDFKRIEMVRGPGSALYGANAYNGVLNLVTPQAREVYGTRVRLAGGELETLRADIRHAGSLSDGEWGYKVSLGLTSSDTWSRSRTNLGDLAAEYAAAIDTSQYPVNTPAPGFEVVPLEGQTKSEPLGIPGPAIGERDKLLNLYGAARLDRYLDNDALFTAEAGLARAENETGVSAVGRLQVGESWRPWARVAYDARRMNLMAYYSGRKSSDQIFITGGDSVEETSAFYHVEGQVNNIIGSHVQWIVGGSVRAATVNSNGTLLPLRNDDRNDRFGALFGQLVYSFNEQFRIVGTGRIDDSNLYKTQFSPRGAIVWTPTPDHSIRATVSGAFQTPNVLEYFGGLPAGPPADFTLLEAALRASALGPALAGVPNGALFNPTSEAVPLLGLGNETLDVERVVSYELGYKGSIRDRLFASIDLYYSNVSNLVTDLLPGANPNYGPWVPPAGVAPGTEDLVADAVRAAMAQAGQPELAAALTNLEDGSTAIVFSIGNAGDAHTYGLELAAGIEVTDYLGLDANYAFFGSDIDENTLVPGDVLLANTPKHKGNLSANFVRSGLTARAGLRIVDGYDWAAGVHFGRIPASQTLDLSAGYELTAGVQMHAVATNLLDQRRYYVYGGSVNGRRVLGGVTVTF